MSLMEHDSEIIAAITAEKHRQLDTLKLIASENFVSEDVLDALGSVLTNKYAEGYPGMRRPCSQKCEGACRYAARRSIAAVLKRENEAAPD